MMERYDVTKEFDRSSTIKNITEKLNVGELRVDNCYMSCEKYRETYTNTGNQV